jgi:uncharacterized protein involved in response to NO
LLLLIGALVVATHPVFQGYLPAVVGLQGLDLLHIELDLVLFIVVVIAGRVIPMFTNNGIPGTGATRHALLEKLALASILLLIAADLLQLPPVLTALIALAAALAHGVRLALWKPWRTFAAPLLWILHAAYAWIVVHLVLRGLADLGLLAGSYAVHALTVGAIGGMTLGMMVRTARGHTGRVLLADRSEVTMFLLVQAAALLRVFAGIASPALYLPSIEFSGVLWAAAFGLYALRYWPVLTRPRLDGKPG